MHFTPLQVQSLCGIMHPALVISVIRLRDVNYRFCSCISPFQTQTCIKMEYRASRHFVSEHICNAKWNMSICTYISVCTNTEQSYLRRLVYKQKDSKSVLVYTECCHLELILCACFPYQEVFLFVGATEAVGDDRRWTGYPKPQDWQMINSSGQVGDQPESQSHNLACQ